MSNIELTVDGMKCGGCSGRLKRVLEGTDGVKSTDIVLETKKVTVEFDEGSGWSATCSRCGGTAMSHDMRVLP